MKYYSHQLNFLTKIYVLFVKLQKYHVWKYYVRKQETSSYRVTSYLIMYGEDGQCLTRNSSSYNFVRNCLPKNLFICIHVDYFSNIIIVMIPWSIVFQYKKYKNTISQILELTYYCQRKILKKLRSKLWYKDWISLN